MNFLETVFGHGDDINVIQMSMRAAVVFWIVLVLIRFSGRRSFGLHSPFDSCITVLLGAILSRAITGTSPFLAAVAAATMLVLIHRLTGIASHRWSWVDRVVSGAEVFLVRDGRKDEEALKQALVTDRDLQEAVRKKTGESDLANVRSVVLERNGELTVIPRNR